MPDICKSSRGIEALKFGNHYSRMLKTYLIVTLHNKNILKHAKLAKEKK